MWEHVWLVWLLAHKFNYEKTIAGLIFTPNNLSVRAVITVSFHLLPCSTNIWEVYLAPGRGKSFIFREISWSLQVESHCPNGRSHSKTNRLWGPAFLVHRNLSLRSGYLIGIALEECSSLGSRLKAPLFSIWQKLASLPWWSSLGPSTFQGLLSWLLILLRLLWKTHFFELCLLL